MSTDAERLQAFTLPRFIVSLLQACITILIPILLLLLSVRLVMSEAWLNYEYQRAGFPADLYGWDTDVRLEYGPIGVEYLLTDADISLLANLEIDGRPAFDPDELAHMEDVHAVTYAAMQVLTVGGIAFVVMVGLLAWQPATRPDLLRALAHGGSLTLTLVGTLSIMVLLAWDFFFDTFHALFFESGSWQFHRSDTLIRLYPQQLWFDSSLLVGVLAIGGALLLAILPRIILRRGRPE